MAIDERLVELLLQWEELREQGQPVSAEELCRDCPELLDEARRRMRFLGALHETSIGQPASLQTHPGAETSAFRPGITVPGFEILGELGRGGMGVVYKARQQNLDRIVALKMILAGAHASPTQRARFRGEAEAAAQLQHPQIVQVHDVGEHNRCPYFSLEFIDGCCLRDNIADYRQPEMAAALIEQLARAVSYAHHRGIIHRDLKPANILLTKDGVAKITDFGLAKRLDDERERTHSGDVLGTPAYMSPEQAAGKTREIGTATDIYALGTILYELLAGRPPFLAATTWEIINQAITQEPTPPSLHCPGLPRDLETICLKCLQKSPAQRYVSALALADDLRRFLDGRPIEARPIGWAERTAKWARRRPAVAALIGVSAAALLALALGGWVASLELYHREQALAAQVQANRQALIRLNVANGKNLLDTENGPAALVWFARALSLEPDETQQALHRVRFASVLQDCPRLNQLWAHQVNITDVAFSPDGRWVLTASADCTAQVWDVGTGEPRFPMSLRHELSIYHAAFSADGRRIVTAAEDRTAKVWDADTGRLLATLRGHLGPVRDAQFSPDGNRVATGSDDKTARLWKSQTGEAIGEPWQHDGAITHVRFRPDGRQVLTASSDGSARLWSVDSGAGKLTLRLRHEGPVTDACFDAQGKQVATASADGTARLWDAGTGRPLGEPMRHLGPVVSVAFRPDCSQLATASLSSVQFWDAKTSKATGVVLRHFSMVNRVVYNAEGSRVATASDDKSALVWDANTGRPVTPLMMHIGSVEQICFSRDGQRLATADSLARVYDLSPDPTATPILKHDGSVWRASFSPDGSHVLTASGDRTGRVWEARTGKELAVLRGHTQAVFDAAYSPEGRHIATAGADGTARIWAGDSYRLMAILEGNGGPVKRVAFSARGAWLATAGTDAEARIWDVNSGTLRATLSGHTGEILDVQFGPDDGLVASAGSDGTARLWKAATGKPVGRPLAHDNRVPRLAFSPDGRWLATACYSGAVQVWDVASCEPIWNVGPRHAGPVLDVCFSGDGGRVLTCGEDNTARIWDATHGGPLSSVMQHHGTVVTARFSADGRRVATASADDTGRVWDAATGEPLTAPLRHQGWGRVTDIAFNSAGDRVVTASLDNAAQVWKLSALDWPADDLQQLAELLGGQRIGADAGSLVPLDAGELRVRWDSLRSRHPQAFGLSP
jgi:WD40 repeat protein/tRNA A-37 threonylcarbamoyl transferase component Bud32